ncbi:MAG TPA: hypothetical protein PKE66_17960, partial [Pyrinomonadaceae bacterium]|nr:hypothetical protein [Pyrinomonadaceae bacterium]
MAKRKRAPTGKKTRTEPPIEPSKTGLNGTIKANTVKTPKSIAEWVPTWLTIDRFLSILAIFLSVTLPLIAYFLLDPQLQGFRNRGKIELSVIPEP